MHEVMHTIQLVTIVLQNVQLPYERSVLPSALPECQLQACWLLDLVRATLSVDLVNVISPSAAFHSFRVTPCTPLFCHLSGTSWSC
jgi:hypothetical protein